MHRLQIAPVVLTITMLTFTACGPRDAAAPRRINIYMYSEYIDPDLAAKFTAETGLALNIVTYENSEEMLAKMNQAGGDREFDVLVAPDMSVPALIKLGRVRAIDRDRISNAANISPTFQNPPFDPGSRYSMPYQWGTVGLMYRKDKFPEGPLSWVVLFEADPPLPGNFVLIDSMRDMLGVALRYTGQPVNSRDPAAVRAAADKIIAAKNNPRCAGFISGVGGVSKILAGEAVAAVVYNGDAIREIDNLADEAERGNLAYQVPLEGSIIWTDVMLICAHAPNPEGAHRFINFILDPENGAQLSNFNRYATPNEAALPLIDEHDREDPAIYPTDQVIAKLEYLTDLGQDTRLYDEVWTAVKAR